MYKRKLNIYLKDNKGQSLHLATLLIRLANADAFLISNFGMKSDEGKMKKEET